MRILIWVASVAVVVAAAGCSGTSSPMAPTATTISPTLDGMLTQAIQDEYRAETIYQGVINDFGVVLPFANVLNAEMRHSAAIARLYTSRGLTAPANGWTVDQVPHFTSVPAACAAGVVAERENIALYDELLRGDLPDDVRQVFTSNRSASLLNHLPAFEACA